MNEFFVTEEQFLEFMRITQSTKEEIEKIKKLKLRIRRPVTPTKNQIEIELMDYDTNLEETSDIILFLNVLINTKQKMINDIFLPEWNRSRSIVDHVSKIKLDLEANSVEYRTLVMDVELIKDWVKYFETLHWVFKSRIDNLRIMHGETY